MPARQLLGEIGVDGFFAISGFLIASNWLHHPRIREYAVARGLRILPGLYVCLVVTGFCHRSHRCGDSGRPGYQAAAVHRADPGRPKKQRGVDIQFDVGGTPTGIPFPGVWDGPLWTLGYELLCYIAVTYFGMAGLLGRRGFCPSRWRCVGPH